MNINKEIGLVIRKHREERGLSQEKFANYCNVSRAYYGRIERGEFNPTIELCFRISSSLGIRLQDLFEDLPD